LSCELAPGRWQGSVDSGYGMHLVFVSERTQGRLSALVDVRDAVLREWTNARRIPPYAYAIGGVASFWIIQRLAAF
jgi:hypothetical protein